MAAVYHKLILAVLFSLIQLSWTRTIPHVHKHCPENSYVAGVSFSKLSDGRINTLRFYCTRQNVLSELSKHGVIQYDLELAEPEIEKNWSEPWFCTRGIAIGIQGNSNQIDTMTEEIRLICSDNSVPELEQQDPAAWSDFVKCAAGQALCGVHEGTNGVINSESAKCCDIPHPAFTCKTSDIWRSVTECVNEEGSDPKTCEYKAVHGISYAGKDAERTVYEDLGFNLESAAPILATKPEFNLKTHSFDWSNMFDVTWALESSTPATCTAQPGYKTKVLQVVGYCGFYKISTPFFKTETGELTKELNHRAHQHHLKAEHHVHHVKKHSDKYDDTEGMQADFAESWEDSEEETPVVTEPKKALPLADEQDKDAIKDGSDEWSDEAEDIKPEAVKVPEIKKANSNEWSDEEDTKQELTTAPEHKKDDSDNLSDEDDVKPEPVEVLSAEPKRDDSDDWSDETDNKPEAAEVPVTETKKSDSDEWSEAQEDVKPEVAEVKAAELQKAESTEWSNEEDTQPPETPEVPIAGPKKSDSEEWSDEEPIKTETKTEDKPEAKDEAVAEAKDDSTEWDTSAEEIDAVPETKPEIDAQLVESKHVAETLAEVNKLTEDTTDEWGDSNENDEVIAIPAVLAESKVAESKIAEPVPVSEVKVEDKQSKKDSKESDEWEDSAEADSVVHIPANAHTDLKTDDSDDDHKWPDSIEEPQDPVALLPVQDEKKSEDIWNPEHDHQIDTDSQDKKNEDSSEVEMVSAGVYGRSEKLQMEAQKHTEDDDAEMAKDEPDDSFESSEEEVKPVPVVAAAPVKESTWDSDESDEEPAAGPVPVPMPAPNLATVPESNDDAWSDEDGMESAEMDASDSNVQPVAEIRVPILSGDTVDSSKQAFGKLQESPKSDDQTPLFDVDSLKEKAKDFAEKVQAGASDLGDKIQAGGTEFVDEAKKVIQEVKDMPIVQDIGKNLQEGMKNSLDSVRGVDLSPKNADFNVGEVPEPQSAADTDPSAEEPKVSKAGGYIGYIVGGMVICVIVVVIAIFVIEKRQNPTPEPKVNKRDYAEVPAPEPLLAGTSDRKITIETEKDDA